MGIFSLLYSHCYMYIKEIFAATSTIFFVNQVTYNFLLLVLIIYLFSKYILPRFVRLFKTRVFLKTLETKKKKIKEMLTYLNQSPLDQFTIRNLFSIKADLLGNIQLSLTNIGLYLIITTIIIFMLYILATNYNIVTPNN